MQSSSAAAAGRLLSAVLAAPSGVAAKLISDEVCGELWRARCLCSDLEHLARQAGDLSFLQRLPEICEALGL